MNSKNHPDATILIDKLLVAPVFERLEADLIARLASTAVQRKYEARSIVFLEGEIARGLYFVHSGWLKENKIARDGREQILQYHGPGEFFNYMGIFADRPNLATVITLEPAEVWLLPRESFRVVMLADAAMAVRVAEALADYVVHLVQLVTDLSLRTVEARLAQRLLEKADANVVYRQQWATQAEIAARLGTRPEVLNRALNKLAEEGLIRVRRDRIWILNREGLLAKALLE